MARELNNIVCNGNSFALELSKPSLVIVLRLKSTYLFLPISLGVNHCISPPQYDFTVVSGVPPPTTVAKSFMVHFFHSPQNSGNLKWGTFPEAVDFVTCSSRSAEQTSSLCSLLWGTLRFFEPLSFEEEFDQTLYFYSSTKDLPIIFPKL